jgi:hypothetical protein
MNSNAGARKTAGAIPQEFSFALRRVVMGLALNLTHLLYRISIIADIYNVYN